MKNWCDVLTVIYKKIEDCIGDICKFIIPIKHEYYFGNERGIAICTLSSVNLLREFSNDTELMIKSLLWVGCCPKIGELIIS